MPNSRTFRAFIRSTVTVLSFLMVPLPLFAAATQMSDAEISRELNKDQNKVIIEEFLKQELREVNEYATKPLLKNHPSLSFFFKQVDKGPFESLLFLEQQVHKLREAQKNINSFPFSISFSAGEKKKILGLRATADRIVSYGIPLMKRDFFHVVEAARELADKRRKHPMELMKFEEFRDAIYRRCEPTAAALDEEMGKLSEGELICMRLGWTLEQVTITRLWLVFNDNSLPAESDYMVFRKKRSEYWQQRLKKIFSQTASEPQRSSNRRDKGAGR
jgi:hypothetical protein